jgi:hypothetical protein
MCRALGSPEKADRPLWGVAKAKLMVGTSPPRATSQTPALQSAYAPSPAPASAPAPAPAPTHVPATVTAPPHTYHAGHTIASPPQTIASLPHTASVHASTPALSRPSTPTIFHSPAPPLSQSFMYGPPPPCFPPPEAVGQAELTRARESIAKLEERYGALPSLAARPP